MALRDTLSIAIVGVMIAVAACGGVLLLSLRAPALPSRSPTVPFTVSAGERFSDTAARLADAGLVRSAVATAVYAKLTGADRRAKAGSYQLSAGMDASRIVAAMADGGGAEAEVTVPEGASIYQIDQLLSDAGVLSRRGSLAALRPAQNVATDRIEGFLFPDTYRCARGTEARAIVERMKGTFARKAGALLPADEEKARAQLVLASILEREVPDHDERRVVAGLLLKRVAAGMPIQADATVCYAKQMAAGSAVSCLPLTAADLKRASPYNTYLHQGLPPGPIGNPGEDAIRAAGSPVASPYWYYVSDPATGKTVFAKTLEEHAENRRRYLP